MPFLQPKISLPRTYTPPHTIRILHPDYKPPEDTLLVLRVFDDGGIDYDTALVACGIIAGNIWTGFFATRSNDDGPLVPTPRPTDGILRGSTFFFQIPEADAPVRPYPIVVRFSDWRFPHGNLPSPWKDLPRGLVDDGHRCRITDSEWKVERAHLVPLKETSWWIREGMDLYVNDEVSSRSPINAKRNVVRLRSDIHKVFDEKVFAIVPRRDVSLEGTGEQGREISLVTHIFNPMEDPYFNATYHGRKLHVFRHSVECLFARFAWVIFSPRLLIPFLTRCVTERQVLALDAGTYKYSTERRDPEQLMAVHKALQSGSASPQKRPAGETSRNHSEVTEEEGSDADSDADSDSDSDADTRGRPLKRRCAQQPQDSSVNMVKYNGIYGLALEA